MIVYTMQGHECRAACRQAALWHSMYAAPLLAEAKWRVVATFSSRTHHQELCQIYKAAVSLFVCLQYCGKDCQTLHWRQHKKDCARLKAEKAAAKK